MGRTQCSLTISKGNQWKTNRERKGEGEGTKREAEEEFHTFKRKCTTHLFKERVTKSVETCPKTIVNLTVRKKGIGRGGKGERDDPHEETK